MTFKILAWTDAPFTPNTNAFGVTHHPEQATKIYTVEGRARGFGSRASAERAASQFPKFVKVRPTNITVVERDGRIWEDYGLDFTARFEGDDVNKGKNETGLKRLRALLKIVAWEYDATAFGNSATPEQFARFIETGGIR